MRTFISILLFVGVVLVPTLSLAQTASPSVPPTGEVSGPPDVVPPTKAPEEVLPATPLPGQTSPDVLPEPVAAQAESAASSASSIVPIAIIGAIVVLIFGAGLIIRYRKRTNTY
ncbi:hypothetical protein A3J11_02465 [Candidatus Kaiserbacteria bacterium RIFCSPLOWO2_02_FULL_55_12]|uniref:Gram-positive cocci surface proteins LPxTG domain-containing protein n=2 Tax=Candidatus Kaiseribacteriota TaxID=1752734 RepID=A0A1F6F1N3_9BACT|nr:MAG: hypothetical protein A3C94_01670 [Candidatus Kaiserbacteria bacterium RIFCSPHIGHO2_02_FULL_55_17]OGG79779.1 MAG: hypothetical protein A3J11_02465 [Candidatus Kaiserbacteria bacterium RIFCSPLOWO2_02_FULL_55_12]